MKFFFKNLRIDVNIKVSAIIETSQYEDKIVTEMQVQPRHEKQVFKEPVLKSSRVPVTGL